MSEDPNVIARHCRITRLVLDGADERFFLAKGYSAKDIESALAYCSAALSKALAEQDNAEYRLLSHSELAGRAVECIRLLLEWEQRSRTTMSLHGTDRSDDPTD